MKETIKIPRFNPKPFNLNLDQLSSKSPSKPSDVPVSTAYKNYYIGGYLPEVRLDSDLSRNAASSHSLQLNNKSVIDIYGLANFTSSLLNSSQSLHQYLGSFKGSALTHLNYEELTHFVYDPRFPVLSGPISGSVSARDKPGLDPGPDSTMSQTTRSGSKTFFQSQVNKTGSLTDRKTEPGTKTFLGKIGRMKSEAQLKRGGAKAEAERKEEPTKDTSRESEVMVAKGRILKKANSNNINKDDFAKPTGPKPVRPGEGQTSFGGTSLQLSDRDKIDKKGSSVLSQTPRKYVSQKSYENKGNFSQKEEKEKPMLNPNERTKSIDGNSINRNRTKTFPNSLTSTPATKRDKLPEQSKESQEKISSETADAKLKSNDELSVNKGKTQEQQNEGIVKKSSLNRNELSNNNPDSEFLTVPTKPKIENRLNVLELSVMEEKESENMINNDTKETDIKDTLSKLVLPEIIVSLENFQVSAGAAQNVLEEKSKLSRNDSQDSNIKKGGKSRASREEEKDPVKETKGLTTQNRDKVKKSLRRKFLALSIGKTFIDSLSKKGKTQTPQKSKQNDSDSALNNKKNMTLQPENPSNFSNKKSRSVTPVAQRSVVNVSRSKEEPDNLVEKPIKTPPKVNNEQNENKSKFFSEKNKVPSIVIISSDKPRANNEHSSRRSSRRSTRLDHSILGNFRGFEDESMGSMPPERKPTKDNPKSWFDFRNKRKELKLKKLRNSRLNTEVENIKGLPDIENEFVSLFDHILRNATKVFVNTPGISKLPEDENEKSTKDTSNFPQQSTEEQNSDSNIPAVSKKTMTGENEVSLPQKGLSLTQPQSGSVQGHVTNDEIRRNSLKFSHREGLIVININPPIEELEEENVVSTSVERSIQILSQLDVPDSVVLESSQIDIPKIFQYKFDTNHRKSIGDEDFGFLDNTSDQYTIEVMDHSYRRMAENLFKFDEIYKTTMDNFNTKSQRLRIRSNFFTYIEKIIIIPSDRGIHNELMSNFILQIDLRVPKSLESGHVPKVFKYKARRFPLVEDSFMCEFEFQKSFEDFSPQSQQGNKCNQVNASFEDDDTEAKRKILESKALIFDTGESFAGFSKLENFSEECARTILCQPLMVHMNYEALMKINTIWFGGSLNGLSRKGMLQESLYPVYQDLSKLLINTSDENWKHIQLCILDLFRTSLHGYFEFKEELGKEKIVIENEPVAENHENNQEAKHGKKRDLFIAGKMWRSGTTVKNETKDEVKKLRSTIVEIGHQPTEPIAAGTEHERKETLLGDHLKEIETLKNKPRRYSKTSIKPFSQVTTLQNKLIHQHNVEKSSTTIDGTAKNNEEVSHKSKLQIPRMETHKGSSASPLGRQETKAEPIEKKASQKLTINYSLTPTSDPSTPKKDDNIINFGSNFGNQSIITSRWNRTRTKTKMGGSERSSFVARQASYGNTSQKGEKEETTQQILWALQAGKLKEEHEIKKRNSQLATKEIISREVEKSPIEPHGNTNSPKNMKLNGAVIMSKSKVPKRKANQPIDKYLFDLVYSNKYQELRELLNLCPRNIINVLDGELNTLLIAAARVGHKEIAELLLLQGCDPNIQNADGNTALHIALSYQNFKVADLLVRSGIKQGITNYRGKTAWEEQA